MLLAVDWKNTKTKKSVESFALESPRTLDLLNAKNMPQKPKPIDGISTENATEVSFDIPKWINTTISTDELSVESPKPKMEEIKSDLVNPPHIDMGCKSVPQKIVCWKSRKDSKCTSVWPDVLIRPENEMPIFLEGWTQTAGLGHVLRSFVSLAVIAAANRLTLRAHLVSGGHGDNASAIKERIFGEYFFSPIPNTCIQTETHKVPIKKVTSVVKSIRKERKMKGTCAVILLTDRPDAEDDKIDPCRIRTAYRTAQRLRLHLTMPPSMEGCKGKNSGQCRVRVSVHLRRGDILRGTPKAQIHWIQSRGLPNPVYFNLINQVLSLLRRHGRVADVTMHVEMEGRNLTQVIDLDGSYSDFTGTVNKFAGETISLGPRDTLDTLEDICRSHILIGSSSGFSHVQAVFCDQTVVLAVRMALASYDYLSNVILVDPVPRQVVKFTRAGYNFTFPMYAVDEKRFEKLARNFTII